MIAVFTKSQKDFIELNPTPIHEFKRIKNIDDIVGLKFSGVIRIFNWYDCDKGILDAYEALKRRQPELFGNLNF